MFGRRTAWLEARCQTLEGQLVQANDVIRELTAQIVGLKREGFQPPAPSYNGAADEDAIPDEVLDAMAEQAKPDDAVWEGIAAQVRTLQREQLPADEIAERVRAGESLEWGDW